MGADCSQPNAAKDSQCLARHSTRFLVDLRAEQKHVELEMTEAEKSVYINQKRLVFVSLTGLYRTYEQCPIELLVSSIFVLSIKTEWLTTTSASSNPIKSFSHDRRKYRKFMQLLAWKKSQGLLFAMLDTFPSDSKTLVAPFWLHLSSKFVSLGLNSLQCAFQIRSEEFEPKYGTKYVQVFTELYCHTMRYKAMQEILSMSNPETLSPITAYSPNVLDTKPAFVPSLTECGTNTRGVWWVSSDYGDEESDDESFVL